LNLAAKRRVETWEERPTSKSNELHWLGADNTFNSVSAWGCKRPVRTD